MLRFLTAGESHGQALVAILEGFHAGASTDAEALAAGLGWRPVGTAAAPHGTGPPSSGLVV